jgi:hypothetical protein
VNETVSGEASVEPDCVRRPVVPPGTVSVSDADGASGAVAAKDSVDEPTCFQAPATAGFRVGMGLAAEIGAERWTVMATSVGTFTAPEVGVVETIDKALAGAPVVDVAPVVPVAPAAGWEGEVRKARVVPTAAMARITTTKDTIHTGPSPREDPTRLE